MKKHFIAINGLGRIGRLSLRVLLRKEGIQIVALNDISDIKTIAHLLKYDSNYGQIEELITHDESHIVIGNQKILVTSETKSGKLPWSSLGVQTVIESTGQFLDRESISQHLVAGAKRVIVAAPVKSDDIPTVVFGVNDHILTTNTSIISNASCTTNCLAPMAKVLDDNFGIEHGYMTTIHAYTTDQRLQDSIHKDLRRARAACLSIIPTSTGAAKSIGLIIPHLKDKLYGIAMRVPVSTGSITDLTVILKKNTTKDEVNKVMETAAEGFLKGIMMYTCDPLVSVDIIGNTHSCIFDSQLTEVNGNIAKVFGWYDNEWGYANRIADLLTKLS